jgi:hypothetical protein
MRDDFDAGWHELAEQVISGMKEWRLQHPKATLREIEQTLDERWGISRPPTRQSARSVRSVGWYWKGGGARSGN